MNERQTIESIAKSAAESRRGSNILDTMLIRHKLARWRVALAVLEPDGWLKNHDGDYGTSELAGQARALLQRRLDGEDSAELAAEADKVEKAAGKADRAALRKERGQPRGTNGSVYKIVACAARFAADKQDEIRWAAETMTWHLINVYSDENAANIREVSPEYGYSKHHAACVQALEKLLVLTLESGATLPPPPLEPADNSPLRKRLIRALVRWQEIQDEAVWWLIERIDVSDERHYFSAENHTARVMRRNGKLFQLKSRSAANS